VKAGLVGYGQSGKATLFNALTGLHKGGSGGRGHVNLGAIKVPDTCSGQDVQAVFRVG